MDSTNESNTPQDSGTQPPIWTYPTRFCRICREDVPPTVTMYPPGIPLQFQRPIVEYVNDDDYGRLIKPCMCRGSSRYIHELCLLRSRTENRRAGSMWKCHECGYQFNFQKLAIQRFLSSRISSGVLTVIFMLLLIFILGFIADPIINLYIDPYDTIMGRESLWDELQVRTPVRGVASAWSQHFLKGMVSMGVVGFLKTIFMNPFHWMNFRQSGLMGSRTTTTGRDRAVNISWIVILVGVSSAFFFFYKWVETMIQKSLQRIGNHIVDTQLPGDDDDIKPPSGWKYEPPLTESAKNAPEDSQTSTHSGNDAVSAADMPSSASEDDATKTASEETESISNPNMVGSWPLAEGNGVSWSSAIDNAHSQGWSFSNL